MPRPSIAACLASQAEEAIREAAADKALEVVVPHPSATGQEPSIGVPQRTLKQP